MWHLISRLPQAVSSKLPSYTGLQSPSSLAAAICLEGSWL